MIDLVSSIVASTVSTSILYPAERIKIQMQLKKQDNSLIQTIKNIGQRNGVQGFYNGITSLIIGNGISYGVYFVAYQKAKGLIMVKSNSMFKIALCSGVAGVISSISTCPFWVLQTKQAFQNKSMLQCASKMIQEQGPLSFWKGVSSSIILVSNPIIQFVIYEFLKKKLLKEVKTDHALYDTLIFIIGAVSKIISTLITFPYTVIRTKQHVNPQGLTLKQVINKIYEQTKLQGFYRGIKPKLLHTVLNSAIMLMIYERIKRIIMNYLEKK